MAYVAILFLLAAVLIAWRFQPRIDLAMAAMLVLVMGSVFGHPFYHSSIAGFPITLDRILLIGVLGLAGYLWWSGKLEIARWNRADTLLVLFLLLLTWNVFESDWRYREKQPLAQLLFNYFLPFGLYLIARNIGDRSRHFRTITFTLMGLGVYLAVTAICEVQGWYRLIFPGFIINAPDTEFLGRGRGPFLNPIACGLFQLMGLCSGLVWWSRSSPAQRAGLLAFAGVMLAGIFCTLTRSVWLSTAVVLGIYVWVNSPRRWQGLMVAAAPVCLLLLLAVAGDRLNSFKRDKEVSEAEMSESIELRPLLAVVATRMVQEKPLMGHGLRQYTKHSRRYIAREHTEQPVQKVLPYVQHNLFLSYAVDIGLIGLSVYLTLIGTWTVLAVKLWRHPDLPWDVRQSGYLLLAFLVAFAVNGMFHDTSVIVMLHHLMFLLAAWVCHQNAYFFAGTTTSERVSPYPAPSPLAASPPT